MPFQTVDEYLASQPPGSQEILRLVRKAILGALPGATESISYQMPAYKVDGFAVIYFAGWKRHFSLYPAGARLVQAFGRDLAPYEVEKGTIRFPLAPPPVKLIARIAKFRLKEERERRNQ